MERASLQVFLALSINFFDGFVVGREKSFSNFAVAPQLVGYARTATRVNLLLNLYRKLT